MNAAIKIGGEKVCFEKSADCVKYGTGTLKDFLDDMKTFKPSDYGKELLKAESVDELRKLLQVRVPEIYDEADTFQWQKVGSPSIN